jgi:hypothetical protein
MSLVSSKPLLRKPENELTLGDVNFILGVAIRHLSKPKREFKIADGSDKIKAQREAFSPVSITVSNNLKTFDKPNHVFNKNPLTGKLFIMLFLFLG